MCGLGDDGIELESVQEPRSAADPRIRISTIKRGCLQGLTGPKDIREIERSVSARDTHPVQRVRFDVDLPGTAPTERAKPNISYVLIRLTGAFDRKPWVYLVAGRAATALEDYLPGM